MRKYFTTFFCLLGVFANTAYPQITKQFEETSYYLQGISFVDTSTGWAVGSPHWNQVSKTYVGTLIKTTDGAKTWNAQDAVTSNSLRKVQFIDANDGWAVGEKGTIMHTSDGGGSWSKQIIATTDLIRCMKFINNSVGWIVSVKPVHTDYNGDVDDWRSSVWKTINGGSTWVEQTISDSAALLNGIDFIDSQNGWIVGIKYTGLEFDQIKHCGAVYHTIDGGQTWKEQKVPKPPVLAPGGDSLIIYTGIDFVNSQKGWVTGFMGNTAVEGKPMYHTSDGGLTWKQDTCSEIRGNLWDVQFIDENRGYIVGTLYGAAWGPPVLRTLDGGLHWKIIHMIRNDGEGLYGLAVFDKKVIAVGDHDYIAKSYDPWGTYGENLFTQEYINPHYSFEDICFTDTKNGWAAGKITTYPDSAGQIIMHTSNGGNIWQPQLISPKDYPSGTPRLNKLCFTDSLTGWAFGSPSFMWKRGNYILHTTDGGKHWVSQDTTIPDSKRELYSGFLINNNMGWALEQGNLYPGDYLTLLKTSDGGGNWSRVNTNISISTGWGVGFALVQGDIFFIDSQNGWAGGYHGGVIHTTDGGLTWTKQNYPEFSNCNAFSFTSSTEGWAADAGALQYTNDAGNTWSEKSLYSLLGAYTNLTDIQFTNSQNGWVIGDEGSILQTLDGGNSWNNLTEDSKTFSNLLGLHFVNDSMGWVAGNEGVILRINSSGIIHNPTRLNKTITNSEIIIYPNPAHESITIRASDNSPYNIQISDMEGRVLLSEQVINQYETINLSGFQRKLYLIRIIHNNNLIVKKIIVQ